MTGLSTSAPSAMTPDHAALDLLRTMADPLTIYSADWRILYLNDPAAALIARAGRTGDVIGRPLFDLFPDLKGSAIEREMRRAMDERVRTTFTHLRQHTGRWANVRCEPLRDGSLAVIWQDVTEQRRAERTLRYLADASRILGASLDFTETIQSLATLVVPELADWCSISVLEAGQVRMVAGAHGDPANVDLVRRLDAKYPLDPAGDTRTARVIRTGESDFVPDISDEMLDRAFPDPEYREVIRTLGFSSVLTVPLQLGTRTLGAMSLVMTGGRKVDEGDVALAEELGKRAGIAVEHARLYRDALLARRAAEDANASKVEFLARMSHELRTPLNAIGGFAELLTMGVRGALSPQQQEDVRRIQRNQTHLQSLISDILNYAKLEVGRLQFDVKPVPIRPSVRAIEQIYSGPFTMQDLTWVSDFDPPDLWVLADADKLQQVMVNLVGNAVKFTPRGGQVAIRGRARGDHVEISISDSGTGIPEDKLDVVFEPFVQVPRPGEIAVGTGLGLAIARDLARGMGGDLRAERCDSGATLVLTLCKASRAIGQGSEVAGRAAR